MLLRKATFTFSFLLLTFNFVWSLPPEKGTPDHDSIYISFSQDGIHFSDLTGPVFTKASSPDIIYLRKPVGSYPVGTLLIYFVDFSKWNGEPHTEHMAVASSTDGKIWSPKKWIAIDDSTMDTMSTDASIVQLSDGRLRLYTMTPGSGRGRVSIRSAMSNDGINFTMEPGVRLEAGGNSEVEWAGNRWVMVTSENQYQNSHVYVSSDGLNWKRDDFKTVIQGGGIGLMQLNESLIRLYTTAMGIQTLVFNAQNGKLSGATQIPFTVRTMMGDPSVIKLARDKFIMVVKVRFASAKSSYLVPPCVYDEMKRHDIVQTSKPTFVPDTIKAEYLNGPNWGLKKNVCEDAGYSLDSVIDKEVLLVNFEIEEKWREESLEVWAVTYNQSCVCLYKTVGKNSAVAPGIMSVKKIKK